MNSEKKVSIVMATYNGSLHLREQLDSIYSQTRIPDEVVVVDDNSTDGTLKILDEYHHKYGLLYLKNKVNLGVSRNFEKAICNCCGDYIAICDQDDVWMPQKIEKLLAKLSEIEGDKPACVSSKSIAVDKELNPLGNSFYTYKDTYSLKDNIFGSKISQGCSMMFNRKLVDIMAPFPQTKFVYDAYIGLLAACTGYKYNIGEPLMYYRHHQNNVVAKDVKKNFNLSRIIEHLRMWKHSSLFEHGRFNILRFIYDNNYNSLSEESKKILEQLLHFDTVNVFSKIIYIVREDYFSCSFKIKKLFCLMCTAILPLSSKDNEF